MSTPEQLIMKIIAGYDPVKRAQQEAARTDPWRWYCRRCGAKGQAGDEGTRDLLAGQHLGSTPCGRHANVAQEKAGRLLHVWTWGS